MQQALTIHFRNGDPSPALETKIRAEVDRLEKHYDRLTSCRVSVEAPHQRRQHGKLYRIRVDVTVPGGELVASRERHDHHEHEDPYVATRDAFDAVLRQLHEFSERRRGNVKRRHPDA